MKRLWNCLLLVSLLISSGSLAALMAEAQEPSDPIYVSSTILSDENPPPPQGGMPGWPVPDKPIPQHEAGQPSRAKSYTTQAIQRNDVGADVIVPLTGLDAMVADGLDPLAGNYRLVGKDSIAVGIYDMANHNIDLETYENTTIDLVAGSETTLAPVTTSTRHSLDITSGDLNGDGVDEQIAAWIDAPTSHIYMALGEMPGTNGRSSSEPAAAAYGDNVDLLVRGYDQALWHAHYNGASWGDWDNDGGGILLSGPAIASRGTSALDAFAIGTDNQVYQNHWDGAAWDGWIGVPADAAIPAAPVWTGPPPELPAPAAVAREVNEFDVFRVAPDRTLRWNHYNGTTWDGWQGLGGMLASGSGAVALDDGRVQVFAVGADQVIWYLLSDGAGWEMDGSAYDWQRVELDGMDPGETPASAPTAVQSTPSVVKVFVRGTDDALWQVTYDGNWGTWSGGAGILASRPTAAVRSTAGLLLFAGFADGSLQQSGDGTSWSAHPNQWLPACCLGTPINTGITAYVTSLTTTPVDHINALDIETGHFRGDGRQQIALIYRKDTFDPSLPQINLRLFDVQDGFRSLVELSQTNVGNSYDYYPKISVGEFDGDPTDEIAIAYATMQAGVRVWEYQYSGLAIGWLKADPDLIYDMTHYYQMNDRIASIQIAPGWRVCVYKHTAPDGPFKCFGDASEEDLLEYNLYTQQYDDLTTIADSISTVIVTHASETLLTYPFTNTDGLSDQRNAYVGVEIFDVDPSDPPILTSQIVDYFDIVNKEGINPAPERTLDITSGDFDGIPNDEIAVIWDRVWCAPGCYDYIAYMHILNVEHDPGWVFSNHDDRPPDETWLLVDEDSNDPYTAEINIAAGDFDGDGREEIVRTWPRAFDSWDWPDMYRNLEVLDWDSDWTTTSIELQTWSNHSYQDALAAGDLNLDLKDEIVFYDSIYDQLKVYEFTGTAINGIDYESIPLGGDEIPILARGDFRGEGIRVGPPSYRHQQDTAQVIAIVNAPPKHEDVIDGVTHNLNADDADTYSQFDQVIGNSTEVSVTTHKDWGVDSEFKLTIGDPDATHVTTSFENSYGENFEQTGGSTKSLTYTQSIGAITDDVLFYTRLDYDVWEYPVYDSLTLSPQGYLSVVWPASDIQSVVGQANSCNSWYRPNHQLMNVWSYPASEAQLLDRASDGSRDLYSAPTYAIGTSSVDFSVEFSTVDIASQSHEYDMGFASSFEAQIGGEEVGVNLGVVEFSTRLPSMFFSTRGEYNYSELSQWTTQTTDETTLSGYFDPIPGGTDYLYDVTPYLYWSESDYLVLDYVTDPSNQAFWSASGEYYNRPDPAFIHPWAEGQCNHLWPDGEFFTSDISIDPPLAEVGDTVTITATLRNFSEVGNSTPPFNQSFKVSFYQGDPDSGGSFIGERIVAVGELGPRAVITESYDWSAAGSGEQHIYVVIDEDDSLTEVHDENDEYTNNKGYAVLTMDEIEFIDMGQAAEKAYHAITFPMGDTSPLSTVHVPLGAIKENLRIEMRSAVGYEGLDTLGSPIEIIPFQSDWENPEANFSFRSAVGDPPAVITIDYAGADLTGFNESDLTLYRYAGGGWVEANRTCGVDVGDAPLYNLQRFPEDDLLVVPVCETSVFTLSDAEPIVVMPVADFTADPISGLVPLSVQFEDLSSGTPTSWAWDFGDTSALSYDQDPMHEYTDPGNYTVTLTVINGFGSDDEVKVAYITVLDLEKLYLPLIMR